MNRNIQIDTQSMKRIENTEKSIIAMLDMENRPNKCVIGVLGRNDIRKMEQKNV